MIATDTRPDSLTRAEDDGETAIYLAKEHARLRNFERARDAWSANKTDAGLWAAVLRESKRLHAPAPATLADRVLERVRTGNGTHQSALAFRFGVPLDEMKDTIQMLVDQGAITIDKYYCVSVTPDKRDAQIAGLRRDVDDVRAASKMYVAQAADAEDRARRADARFEDAMKRVAELKRENDTLRAERDEYQRKLTLSLAELRKHDADAVMNLYRRS